MSIAAQTLPDATPATSATLLPVTVRGTPDRAPNIAGFGDLPLSAAPFSAAVFGQARLRDLGAARLADLTRVDPAIGDAYNAEGYWDQLAVRGFTIDNRFNYRRDGLPINAETSLPLDNKARVEVLFGTSGLQSGTSAPGGLVNLVVKRPGDAPVREALLQWRQPGSVLGAVDLSQRFGVGGAFGVRVNAAAEHLDPPVHDAHGQRTLFAVAADWRITPGALLEVEIETSHRSQPSQPGFSLLGNTLPAARSIDPRTNLNNQPWSQPVVLEGTTASLRHTQTIAPGWRWIAHVATQQLHSDDRLAYPFGCGKEGQYDRYCSDGSFDLYDFRSDGERRRQDAAQFELQGVAETGPLAHTFALGVLRSGVHNRFNGQANNLVGSGNIAATAVTPADPALAYTNTDRDERSTEVFARDAVRIGPATTAWLGLRHTSLRRDSVDTDGTQATAYGQSFTTPWLALSQALDEATTVYASWGRGVESDVTPNRDRYTDAGQALPTAQSRQWEAGVKARQAAAAWSSNWSLAWFDIVQPVYGDLGADCASSDAAGSCTRGLDGAERHRGLDARAELAAGRWSWQGGLQWLQARRNGSADASIDGQRPTNVPAVTLRLQARHDLAAVPGLALQANLLADSNRIVLPDNSIAIPGFARLDAGLQYATTAAGAHLLWRAGLDNVLDRRAWRESPYEYGHVYLYPMPPRTWRVSLETSL